jgi:hypothetical protein
MNRRKHRQQRSIADTDSSPPPVGKVAQTLLRVAAVVSFPLLMYLSARVGLHPAYGVNLALWASLGISYFAFLVPYQLRVAQQRMAELEQAQREHEQRMAEAEQMVESASDDTGLAAPSEASGLYRDDLRPLDAKLVQPDSFVVKRASTAPVESVAIEPPKILS